jgi:tetratricopeptide (TPR) repeat protein
MAMLASLGMALASSALAGGSQVLSATGQVQKVQAGQANPLHRGDTLDGAYNLRTAELARAQITLDDGSILTLPGGSEISVGALPNRSLQLVRGGVDVLPAKGYVTLEAMGLVLKADGYLRLRQCAADCAELPGLYGRALSGEVIVEYTGGRAVLRNKPFRAVSANNRPQILARETAVLADDAQADLATPAKQALAEELKSGMDAFKNGQYDSARQTLQAVLEQSPTEKIVPYYLGLIALEQKDNDAALKYLQQYSRDDPEAARARGVGQLLTLLLTKQLQDEVKQAIQQESTLTNEKPEPNTIAVQAFSNRGDANYAALAKGIAALVITDLSKVPGLKVLERQKVQKLMDEIRLGESGLVSQDSVQKAGRLMKAEKVLVGSFGVQ